MAVSVEGPWWSRTVLLKLAILEKGEVFHPEKLTGVPFRRLHFNRGWRVCHITSPVLEQSAMLGILGKSMAFAPRY